MCGQKDNMKKHIEQTHDSSDISLSGISEWNGKVNKSITSFMEETKSIFSCKRCNKTALGMRELKVHIEGRHIAGVQFDCPKCDRTFETSTSTNQHMYLVHKDMF